MQKTLTKLPVSSIYPDPDQPRKVFSEDALQELASSIGANGLLQPISVRKNGEGYIIIAGERRWRATKILGLAEIDAVIIDKADFRALQLIENLNREDLNPVEVAKAYKLYLDEGHTTQELSDVVGIQKAQITWQLKVLDTTDMVQALVAQGHIGIWVGVELAKLTVNGQNRALRVLNSERLSTSEAVAYIQKIWMEENEVDMFPEAKLSDDEIKARGKAKSAIEKACQALAELGQIEKEDPGILASSLASEIDVTQEKLTQLMNGIRTLKKSLDNKRVAMLKT